MTEKSKLFRIDALNQRGKQLQIKVVPRAIRPLDELFFILGGENL